MKIKLTKFILPLLMTVVLALPVRAAEPVTRKVTITELVIVEEPEVPLALPDSGDMMYYLVPAILIGGAAMALFFSAGDCLRLKKDISELHRELTKEKTNK